MSTVPAVIVRKGGFLNALFHGLFGFLIVVVICASGLGFYGLRMADKTVNSLFVIGGDIVSGLPEWRQQLPPILGEALDDRRAPEYRTQIEVSVETLPSPRDPGHDVTVVEVANKGAETISVLALNIVFEVGDVPVAESRVYAATPFTFNEDDWRGPLLPNDTRRFTVDRRRGRAREHERGLTPTVQVTELRVWNGPRAVEADADLAGADPPGQEHETYAG